MKGIHHFPLTLIKQVISGNSPFPSMKLLAKGSNISNLELRGEITISVSETGTGDGVGEYERSPGVNPIEGSLSPVGGEKRKGPDDVGMVSVVGLKLRLPEKAISERSTSAPQWNILLTAVTISGDARKFTAISSALIPSDRKGRLTCP